jgi:hypothetical protein
MFNPNVYQGTRFITETTRISSKSLVTRLLSEIRNKYDPNNKQRIRIKSVQDAEKLKHIINEEFPEWPSLQVPKHDTALQVDYVSSNLNKGFIFYLICSGCERRVLHLYQPTPEAYLKCRNCHNLSYKKDDYRSRRIRRLIKSPDLLINYLQSTYKNYEVAVEAIEVIKSLKTEGHFAKYE